MSESNNDRNARYAQFAERLIDRRKALGLTVAAVVEKLQCPRSRYSNWELGLRWPSITEIPRIAHVLGCSPSYLVGWTEQQTESGHAVIDRAAVTTADNTIVIDNATDVAALREHYLDDIGVAPGQAIMIRVDDNAVSTAATAGDLALIDMTQRQPKARDLYGILVNNRIWLRWIRPELDGGYTISTDDAQYAEQRLTAAELDGYHIIGRVRLIIHQR